MNDFLPEGYVQPESSGGYLKFAKEGTYRFRFLTSPITGWVWFVKETGQTKPTVYRIPSTEPKPAASLKPKFFWAAIVWDYAPKSSEDTNAQGAKILEIFQSTIQNQIVNLNKDPDWGNPKEYDLSLNRKGLSMDDTEYMVNPKPKTDLPDGALEAAAKINLNALYDGSDPFAS